MEIEPKHVRNTNFTLRFTKAWFCYFVNPEF